jgi:hypothetical protein
MRKEGCAAALLSPLASWCRLHSRDHVLRFQS